MVYLSIIPTNTPFTLYRLFIERVFLGPNSKPERHEADL